ncbi:FitA-like ribbon-helix-helix domain-containing protein [Rhizohabitans arisaemae]|uniref:FitA-like ribbon-helix-helix domain-containing protein n=1 Tax=Rhizohabitans arisaemae TaxID=2720610 RepID=UPI0024B1DBD9|nr:hypothetical protein [Rhizohabitans arisaemae]
MGTIQIRNVPEATILELKARAERAGRSLSAYLRELLNEEVSTPPIGEVMAGIAASEPIPYDPDFIRETIRDGRL